MAELVDAPASGTNEYYIVTYTVKQKPQGNQMVDLLITVVILTAFVVHCVQEYRSVPQKVPQGTADNLNTQLEQMGAIRKDISVDENGDLVRHEVFQDEETGIVIKRSRKVKPLGE